MTYQAYQTATIRLTNLLAARGGHTVEDRYGHLPEFWRIGGQTVNLRTMELADKSVLRSARADAARMTPRLIAARQKAAHELAVADADLAAIIEWHQTAAIAAGVWDDEYDLETYRRDVTIPRQFEARARLHTRVRLYGNAITSSILKGLTR